MGNNIKCWNYKVSKNKSHKSNVQQASNENNFTW